MTKTKKPKCKTIFALSVKIQLSHFGIEPIMELDNVNKKGYKCWVYEITPVFSDALQKIWGGKENG